LFLAEFKDFSGTEGPGRLCNRLKDGTPLSGISNHEFSFNNGGSWSAT
jgi:hypothetical protein